MKIVVDHVKDTPLFIHIDEPLTNFPLLAVMQDDNDVSFTGSIQGDLTVSREFDTLRVSGRIVTPITLSCSRCLRDIESFVDTSFTIFFRKDAASEISTEDELELAEMDLLSSTYTGNEIDLNHEIEEQIAMEIPLKPLCTDLCKGLCHVCGVDLNEISCICNKEQVSLAFSSLKDFKVSKK
ncbi:MAG: DUF177 domain-containing protein [Desulfuromonadaceae bacterium]|nr:DUF177 domain-containing protein [Desulfuromonadaceae bacterium]MDD2856017.1 DUF177 domain-containing protein [Desulfuromonadaceae bacterium]